MPQRQQVVLSLVLAFSQRQRQNVNGHEHFSLSSGNQVWKFSCIGLSSQDAEFEFVAYEIFFI